MNQNYDLNINYWSGEYFAPNVESFIFRFYGRILKCDFGIDGSKNEKVFDFGCGQGGALKFFQNNGFDVYGVDIAERDLAEAQKYLGKGAHLQKIAPNPNLGDTYFREIFEGKEWMQVVISIQTLDFLSDTDCQIVLTNLYNSMLPGAVIYASFNGTKNYYFQNSTPIEGGDGLRHVKFNNGRVNYDLKLNFCDSKEAMREKFGMFKPTYLDYYDSSFREEGSEFRWTFCGTKQ